MQKVIILPLLALAMLMMASPAHAITESAPVRVTACFVNQPVSSDAIMIQGVSLTNGVTIGLENVSGKTITSLTATGTYHGRRVTDTAKWNFKPGTSAELTRRYTPSVFVDTHADCSVTHVEFADGTSWTLPGSPYTTNAGQK